MDSAPKILYTASRMTHIEQFHREYINALASLGYSVKIMSDGVGADLQIPLEKRFFSPKNIRCALKIRKIIRSGSFDAIIMNTTLSAFWVRIACPRKNRPRTVNIVHGYLFSEGTGRVAKTVFLLCEKLLRKKTDVIITMNDYDYLTSTSHSLATEHVYRSRGMGVKPLRISRIPDTIIKKCFERGAFTLLFVGELSKRKNQLFLINALAKIKKKIPNARLILVGDGDEKNALMKRATRLSLENDVIFAGSRPDVYDFLKRCDLYVTSSKSEGLAHNLAEAVSLGKTALASKVKGHTDVVTDSVSGFLYDPQNIDEFVNKTFQFHENKLSLETANIKNAFKKYEWNSVFPETLSLIIKAIKN